MNSTLPNAPLVPRDTRANGIPSEVFLPPQGGCAESATISNSSFRAQQPLDESIQISPVGLFPHARGIQNVDRPALESIVKSFRSFLGRLGRRFAGLPFYIGHPDVPGYENIYPDRKAYGWIMELEVRDDGLYARTQWSAAGRDLIENGHFKFLSPYWEAKRIGSRDGREVYSPTVLKSVGLTNEPNLPVLPLANTETEIHENFCFGAPISLVTAQAGEQSLDERIPNDTLTLDDPDSQPQADSASASLLPDQSAVNAERWKSVEEGLANCQRDVAQMQQRLLTAILDNAISQSRILPTERNLWKEALTNNFEEASATLANTEPQLNTKPLSSSLLPIQVTAGIAEKQKRILNLVNDRMRCTGLPYHDAWVHVRTEHPELF